jgi:hypothetical protein
VIANARIDRIVPSASYREVVVAVVLPLSFFGLLPSVGLGLRDAPPARAPLLLDAVHADCHSPLLVRCDPDRRALLRRIHPATNRRVNGNLTQPPSAAVVFVGALACRKGRGSESVAWRWLIVSWPTGAVMSWLQWLISRGYLPHAIQ